MPYHGPMAWLTLLAVFALGLRHGLDPDHIASVDALTYQGGSRWAGALFALGHGGAVTLVAVLVSLLSARGQVPAISAVFGGIDLLLAVLFAIAWLRLRRLPA